MLGKDMKYENLGNFWQGYGISGGANDFLLRRVVNDD